MLLNKTTNIGGIKTSTLGRVELANLIGEICYTWDERKKPFVIFSNNGHAISIYNSNKEAKEQMDQADLIHADGQSVVFFSKFFSDLKIKERTATTDMIHDIPNYYKKPLKHFLLGGKESIVNKTGIILSEKYDNFFVCGSRNGYFNEIDELNICEEINASKADVLWVGLGKPKEQLFCIRNKDKLTVPVIISCGGCYNFVTGDYKRAPVSLQKYGLEWLHRLALEPKKLFFRYLITNPHAVYSVIVNRYFK